MTAESKKATYQLQAAAARTHQSFQTALLPVAAAAAGCYFVPKSNQT